MKLSFKKSKNIRETSLSSEIKPHKHWQILLLLTLFISIVLIILSLYLLIKIKKEDFFSIKEQERESPEIIKENILTELTEYFQQKKLKSDQILNNPTLYPDPGLD